MEVASATPRNCTPRLSLPRISVETIRTASLFEPRHLAQRRLLPGDLARPTRCLFFLDSVLRRRPANAEGASNGHATRLSGSGHRQRAVGAHRVNVEGARLSRHQHNDASFDDPLRARKSNLLGDDHAIESLVGSNDIIKARQHACDGPASVCSPPMSRIPLCCKGVSTLS